jgi:drug/metabolite transporter superfamily protein YnfA
MGKAGRRLAKFQILGEFWQFLRVRKKWWLTPIVLILLLFSVLLILAESSAVAPFIYALF